MFVMEPRIEYATTADGYSLAYWAMGSGVPLVTPPPASPWSNIQRELDIPEWRHWYEHLTDITRVVRYDGRGAGLSDRDVTTLTPATELADLEAVVDAAGLRRFALFGVFYAGLTAIEYAVKHPEHVSHLILWCSFARAADLRDPPGAEAMRKLLDVDYNMFTETLSHEVFGWDAGEPAHRLAEYMQESLTHDLARAAWAERETLDVSGLLASIQCPTLILHRRQFPLVAPQLARELAAGIPDARIILVDGRSLSPYIGDMETPLRHMADFLGAETAGIEGVPAAPAGFRAIMFTDIEGSTATTQMVGDAVAQEMVRTHNDIVRRALHKFDGTEVKHTGDGIMASFLSPAASLECAIAIQRSLAAHTTLNADHPKFSVRIGINAGEPVIEDGDLFGTAVQVASRICARAEPRQILVSDVLRQLVAGKGFLFADCFESELRGFEDPVHLFEVRWHEGMSG